MEREDEGGDVFLLLPSIYLSFFTIYFSISFFFYTSIYNTHTSKIIHMWRICENVGDGHDGGFDPAEGGWQCGWQLVSGHVACF
jgi:hypothetical protein